MTIYCMDASVIIQGHWFFPMAYCIADTPKQAFEHFSEVLPALYPDVKIVSNMPVIDNPNTPLIIHAEPREVDRLYASDLTAPDKAMVAVRLVPDKK